MPATTIEEAMQAFLGADEGFAAVSPGGLFPDVFPESLRVWPATVYRHTAGANDPYLSGEPNDLNRDTFEFVAEGDKRIDAARVRDRLLAVFGDIRACRGFWTPDVFVSGCMIPEAEAAAAAPADGSERVDRQARVSVQILWGRR